MDILSYGKASSTLRATEGLEKEVVGQNAEGPFLTVDARMDWLEAQTAHVTAQATKLVALEKASFTHTIIQNGKLELEKRTPTHYRFSGVWETDVLDLGSGWLQTTNVEVKEGS